MDDYGAVTDAPNVKAELQKNIEDLTILKRTVSATSPKLLTQVSQKDRLLALIDTQGSIATNLSKQNEETLANFDIDGFRNNLQDLLDNVAEYMAEIGDTKNFTGLIKNTSFELGLVAILGLLIYWLRKGKAK
ncbi:MAG: hypothetical protein Q8L34_04365 [Candidatus Woesearchaeota archaeon]|nr:hypothetical protein [Candidatus Woesearchaeota archaeon]